jgi:2-hydroxychromene-2-carboxylate isomerase
MSVRTAIVSTAAGYWTSAAGEAHRRKAAERERKSSGAPHCVDVFIDPADPYTALLLQLLPAFAARYAVVLKPWLVGPPNDGAAPERSLLADWSRKDAGLLAARSGLAFDPAWAQPSADATAQATAQIAARLNQQDWLEAVNTILNALWQSAPLPHGPSLDAGSAIADGNARRESVGHYLGAVLHYGGEHYWGIDRLHYLEERLTGLGLNREGSDCIPLYAPPPDSAGPVDTPKGGIIHWYPSFRSPYTWISASRVKALADLHGAELRVNFVLPMVMRSLPVPKSKRKYITLDTAREARRLGIAFGKVADPVGAPVERGYSLMPWAIEQGRGFELAQAFLRGAFSMGIDAGSDSGLKRIVTMAGLDWKAAKPLVGNQDWHPLAEANRAEMVSLGLWGVPSFRVGGTAVWGQDRLWVIDQALRG